jgi:hypothetical protein
VEREKWQGKGKIELIRDGIDHFFSKEISPKDGNKQCPMFNEQCSRERKRSGKNDEQ